MVLCEDGFVSFACQMGLWNWGCILSVCEQVGK